MATQPGSSSPTSFTTPMAPWPALLPYARQTTSLGSELFYFDTHPGGTQPACLLVHGLGDEADTWRSVLPTLADSYRVVALDLPGFGRSALPQPPPGVPAYVDTLSSLLDKLQLQQVTLVGHSLGAILSQQFALQYPHRVSRLVLLGGGLAAGITRLDLALILFLVPGLGELAYNNLRRDPQAAYKTLYPYYSNLDALPQVERDFLFLRVNQRVWSDKQRKAFLTTLRSLARWLPAQQTGLPQRLAGCQVPTSILWGADDRIADPQNAGLLAGMLPSGTQVSLVPRAGHNLHQETPQEVLRLITLER